MNRNAHNNRCWWNIISSALDVSYNVIRIEELLLHLLSHVVHDGVLYSVDDTMTLLIKTYVWALIGASFLFIVKNIFHKNINTILLWVLIWVVMGTNDETNDTSLRRFIVNPFKLSY